MSVAMAARGPVARTSAEPSRSGSTHPPSSRGPSARQTTTGNARTAGNATLAGIRRTSRRHRRGERGSGLFFPASNPEGANKFFRSLPKLSVDAWATWRSATRRFEDRHDPQGKYAGRLAGDTANTLGQTEQTRINGHRRADGNCGRAACVAGATQRMALDRTVASSDDGEYYAKTGPQRLDEDPSFHYPGCTPVGSERARSRQVNDGTKHDRRGHRLARRAATTRKGAGATRSGPGRLRSVRDGGEGRIRTSVGGPRSVVPDGGGTETRTSRSARRPPKSGMLHRTTHSRPFRAAAPQSDLVATPGQASCSPRRNPRQATRPWKARPGFGSTNTIGRARRSLRP